MPYSTVADLIIGDITLGSFDPQKFVDDATVEIDSKLSRIYVLPLVVDPDFGAAIPDYTTNFLKKVSNHLASGRLILALNATGGDDTLNQYGAMLVKDALAELDQVANGIIDLVGVLRAPPHNPGGDTFNGPTIVNEDAYSATETFYAGVMGRQANWPGVMPPWRPGA